MKLFSIAKGLLVPPLLAFVLAACDGRKEVAQVQVEETKATEPSVPPESAERRKVREMLESVVIPQIDFSQTSAEECADYVAARIKQIAPAKAVKVAVRRPMPLDEEGKPILRGQFCYSGHTWKAENISAWQALERIASNNRMAVEVDETGVQLMPLTADGKPVELLRPLEE
jgi:hypothetical protein